MSPDNLRKLARSPTIRKRLAKFMAQQCFRNTEIENIHAGLVPSSSTGDFSDVKVVTPFGEIAWNELSRISQEEMKALNIECVDKCYTFLSALFANGDLLVAGFEKADFVPYWDEPKKRRIRKSPRSK